MLKQPISITALASISALGSSPETIWEQYLNDNSKITEKTLDGTKTWLSQINVKDKHLLEEVRLSDAKYKSLDASVLQAIYTSRKAVSQSGWDNNKTFGVNFGSSRGATTLFENYHKEFLQTGKTATLSSPTTTLGNISSWVANDLKTQGPDISHSITCSTALHSVLNAVAWMQSGLSDTFLVGGSEAPLTPFTIAQMRALKIYSKEKDSFPCRALDLNKNKNTMVLGEGAVALCLEKTITKKTIAKIEGIGFATETLTHNTSITAEAECFQKSMHMACKHIDLNEVDVIVMHAPGTILGDISEVKAISKVFGNKLPFLTTNKWKIGHTFGASGLLSLELAVLMLQHQQVVNVPFAKPQEQPKQLKKILVNAVGFGGNAVSLLLSL